MRDRSGLSRTFLCETKGHAHAQLAICGVVFFRLAVYYDYCRSRRRFYVALAFYCWIYIAVVGWLVVGEKRRMERPVEGPNEIEEEGAGNVDSDRADSEESFDID
eukprot:1687070-Rhodomonas_salina.1